MTARCLAAFISLTLFVLLGDARAATGTVPPSANNGSNRQVCTPLVPAASHQSPVDLYESLTRCVAAGQYEAAVDYYALAGVYGRYDTYRVADTSAHQIVGVLKNAALGDVPPLQKAEFQKFASETYDNTAKHQTLCERAKAIGKPKYFPAYMVAHGLNSAIDALQGGASSVVLVTPFDADSAWLKATSTYLGCQ